MKGHDHEFDEFLVRLFEQDYPTFRVIFAVEAETDGAVPAIEKCRSIAPDRVTLVVARQHDAYLLSGHCKFFHQQSRSGRAGGDDTANERQCAAFAGPKLRGLPFRQTGLECQRMVNQGHQPVRSLQRLRNVRHHTTMGEIADAVAA